VMVTKTFLVYVLFRLILLVLYHLSARLKLRKLHAFFQILKDTGVQNWGQVVKLLASMSLFWVLKQSMELSIRKTMKNRKVRSQGPKMILSHLSSKSFKIIFINLEIMGSKFMVTKEIHFSSLNFAELNE